MRLWYLSNFYCRSERRVGVAAHAQNMDNASKDDVVICNAPVYIGFFFGCKVRSMKKNGVKKAVADVAIIMGSKSDWDTMQHAARQLDDFGISYESLVISAHRTPKRLFDFADNAASEGFKVIIAGAGGAAHLPGMAASLTDLPVLGVPVESKALQGLDSLLSIAQMPAGIPVGTLAIGKAGAVNAALLAASILALSDPKLSAKLTKFRKKQTASISLKP